MLESFKHYGIFLVIAIFVGSVLLSNRAGVNLTHHHNLPQMTQKNKVYCSGVFSTTCSIRLTSEITKREDYQEVLETLSKASARDVIYFHLAGNGGQVASEIQLLNGIKNSKAKVIMVIEGDVYSAHANLAIAGDEIQIGDHLMFLFHRTSGYGQEAQCEADRGKTDRTQSSEEKCRNYLKNHLLIDEALTKKLYKNYLTEAEIKAVLEGHDVIISGEEMKKRIKQRSK